MYDFAYSPPGQRIRITNQPQGTVVEKPISLTLGYPKIPHFIYEVRSNFFRNLVWINWTFHLWSFEINYAQIDRLDFNTGLELIHQNNRPQVLTFQSWFSILPQDKYSKTEGNETFINSGKIVENLLKSSL